MQISSAATSHLFSPNRVLTQTYSSSTEDADGSGSTDQAVLNLDPTHFTTLLNEAKSMPEVRDEVVASYKARISSGNYPSQQVVSGLAAVLSGVLAQRANSSED